MTPPEAPPEWLFVGANVQKMGGWPRVNLMDGTMGVIQEVRLDMHGYLREFVVKWADLTGYSHGVVHPGWHASFGNVIPFAPKD